MTVPRGWVLVGHYFRVLAIASILAIPASLIHGKGLRIDLGFILLFWIANGLMEGRKTPRIIALLVCAAYVAGAVGWLGYTAFADAPRDSMLLATLTCSLFLLLFLPPLTLLLRPSLLETPEPAPDQGPPKPRRPIGVYLVAALFVGTLTTGLEMATVRVKFQAATTGIPYGNGSMGSSILVTAHSETSGGVSGPNYLSSWIIGESPTSGRSSGSPSWVTVGDWPVRLPDLAPERHVRGLESIAEPVDQPNILIVRGKKVIPIRRRITFNTLAAAERAIHGCRDLDEVRRKLESLLPEVRGTFPPGLY